MSEIFLLLILFQIKHFIADYPLQGTYMLQKMKLHGWMIPLIAHSLVHAFITAVIILVFAPSLWYLAIVDFVIHFIVDRIKASPNFLNRWAPDNRFFWWSLGADQMAHHLTHYFIIFIIIRGI